MLVSAPAISSENVTTFEVGNAPFGADRNQLSYLFINSYGERLPLTGLLLEVKQGLIGLTKIILQRK